MRVMSYFISLGYYFDLYDINFQVFFFKNQHSLKKKYKPYLDYPVYISTECTWKENYINKERSII